MCPMHRLTYIFIGESCDSASIQDYEVGRRRFRGTESLGQQGCFNGSAVRLRSAAAEVLNMETLH